jgi:hypothetical protein
MWISLHFSSFCVACNLIMIISKQFVDVAHDLKKRERRNWRNRFCFRPCLDPQFGGADSGTVATVPVSENCSNFCF